MPEGQKKPSTWQEILFLAVAVGSLLLLPAPKTEESGIEAKDTRRWLNEKPPSDCDANNNAPFTTRSWWVGLLGLIPFIGRKWKAPNNSWYFSAKKIEANWKVATLIILCLALTLGYLVLRGSVEPEHKPYYLVSLFLINVLPVIWWWCISQHFSDWLVKVEDEDRRTFEEDRFKVNADHAKAFFAALSTILAGLILKVVLDKK